jgi:hypothetical protein
MIFPSCIYSLLCLIPAVADALGGFPSVSELGAQDMHWEKERGLHGRDQRRERHVFLQSIE